MKIKSLKESEKDHLLAVLNQTHWDLVKTSRLLKISLDLLKAKIKAFGLDQQEEKTDRSRPITVWDKYKEKKV